MEKTRSNFCEYFDFLMRDWSGKESGTSSSETAKEAFQKLFGD
jgi:hypothetical protein